MGKETLTGVETINHKSSFLRPLVDKIRHLDVKWILAGTFVGGIIVGSLVATSSPILGIGAFGISIIVGGLLVCATDAFEIVPRH